MNEIEELFEICNKGHKRMSGAAKFWVTRHHALRLEYLCYYSVFSLRWLTGSEIRG